ncbi:tetratricopeptide repeat protein [Sphingomonas sp. G-3-2-10]|uniref:tetratricopeptide repeat protein n=1 Tax=Sphingomonas sp. G-3-2-10 TaxID=2728838 RepID=UPI00146D29D4|nr:tetratricopeptide repeat protein [Sphingomonas sp. G-3-2-10]NML04340.1 tetratricopeptide repeat protein [Sphingomonas sp. G-3-2-10]
MSAERRDRIDGWKSIGAYFGRDRTTAIRWARERDLPVHRIPGGKTGTVFALRHELELWARGAEAAVDPAVEAEAPVPAEPAPPSSRLVRRIGLFGAAAIGLLGIGSFALPALTPPPVPAAKPTAIVLPADPAIAERFMAARDLVAERDAVSLERAIELLRDVTKRDPGYAAGHAALAEALILSREFGMRDDAGAFFDARIAARNALRLDPRLSNAHRMLGFIAYWWDRDIVEARAAFERAIDLAPDDPIAHFWYGNVLADHGDAAVALKHLNAARTMQPGSVAILTDLAWAQWSAGEEAEPLAALTGIARSNPDFAVAHDCLGIIRYAGGDVAGYAAALARFAELRHDKALGAHAEAVRTALAQGAGAANDLILRHALAEVAAYPNRTHAWPAFVASTGRDRARLVEVLRIAEGRKERWGDAGLVLRMKQRWAGDAEITRLIAAMRRG